MAKNAWDILETAHEGASVESETICEFYAKLHDLSNQAFAFGEKYSNTKLVRKVLRSLLERFLIKITAIEEAKNLEQLVIDEILDSLQTFEKIDCKFSSFHI
ncbi:hypothetical protein ERO13_D09G099050v2 [Gossypium hirsutum]|uniref:Uncharacterized protein n=3 Tax=Gossypium TaxID=3633 RepID=A0A5J5Q1N6_GOSBA|nr:hypothetical protein ES319_D09G112200v1 [Gossypium barbadense]KAG4129718.1 hypothetical protein ERO13_D09G099050v2 [Gossypium hirsutum]TYG53644.1 hypothetical protein ES288_D09G126100v1 [Gossypium darwinii]TYH53750.1 hypothetical protein ES332_D09G122200v1 [Gossypium tomentosum]